MSDGAWGRETFLCCTLYPVSDRHWRIRAAAAIDSLAITGPSYYDPTSFDVEEFIPSIAMYIMDF